MTTPGDDGELVARIGRQDEAALRLLFTRHQAPIFRFLTRRVYSEALAEELTNQVFLEVWRNARTFQARATVSTWMLTIARNLAASHMRKRREGALDEGVAEAIADDSDDPEITAQKADKAAAMRRCMARLTAEHREIIDLVYYHEMSVMEVSAVVGIPEATVKTRMFYARKKLSELLLEAGIDRGWP